MGAVAQQIDESEAQNQRGENTRNDCLLRKVHVDEEAANSVRLDLVFRHFEELLGFIVELTAGNAVVHHRHSGVGSLRAFLHDVIDLAVRSIIFFGALFDANAALEQFLDAKRARVGNKELRVVNKSALTAEVVLSIKWRSQLGQITILESEVGDETECEEERKED